MSQDATSRLVLERPGPGRPQPYRFPAVLRQTAADGRGQVVAAHLPGQPLAVAKLLLDAGAGREPAGREGLASVLARALEEGTAVRDAAAYALALEGLGAELFTAVDWDSFRVGVEAPVERLPAAVELLAEAGRTRSPRRRRPARRPVRCGPAPRPPGPRRPRLGRGCLHRRGRRLPSGLAD